MIGRLKILALALAITTPALAAPPPAPKTVAVGKVVEWGSDTDGETADYRIGPYTLFLSSVATVPAGRDIEPDARSPQLTISGQRDHAEVTLTGVMGFADNAFANFVVVRLDPASKAASVVMTSFSGGAHCCTEVQVATPSALGWTVSHLGSFDNEPLMNAPRDLDGDGTPDLVIYDSRFAYAFDSYAGSVQPMRIYAVRRGVVVEVSREPRFRKALSADMAEAAKGCREHGNGACAAYVADAARLGRLPEAWAVMLKSYNRELAEFPDKTCDGRIAHGDCPKGHAGTIRDFPTALKLFITEMGYLPAKP